MRLDNTELEDTLKNLQRFKDLPRRAEKKMERTSAQDQRHREQKRGRKRNQRATGHQRSELREGIGEKT